MATVLFTKGMTLENIPPVTITRTINQSYLVACLSQLRQDYQDLANAEGVSLDQLKVSAEQVLDDLANIILVRG